MRRFGRRRGWLVWLALWALAWLLIGLASSAVAGQLLPPHLIWASSAVLASAVMLLFVSPPNE